MAALASLPKRCWRALEWAGLGDAVRQAYFTLRAAPHGYRYRTNVGDASAQFAMETWFEYKRVKRLHGERAVLERLLADLHDGAVFWDIGANVGIYSCLVAAAPETAAVVGFEPEPENRARLRENLAANDPDCRWRVSPVALFHRDETRQLAAGFSAADRDIGAGHYYVADTGDRAADCRTAASLVESGWDPPDIVKIDVQGAELCVLRGFGSVLDAVETAYVELHTGKASRYGTTVEETEQFLRDAGFALEYLGEPHGYREGVYHVRASR